MNYQKLAAYKDGYLRVALSMILALVLSPCGTRAAAQDVQPEIPARITQPVDETRLVKLAGNTHPLARPEFDQGRVDPNLAMDRMMLVLERSPEQEAALEEFMARQTDPASPDYHHWLSPAEFGALYGPAESDIQGVTNWLGSHGFTVDRVSTGRTFIEFSGNAAQVEQAFHVEMHHYNVGGAEHISNSSDPSIPEALRPVIAGVASLNNFFSEPQHISMGNFRRDPETGKWQPLDSPADQGQANPDFVVTKNNTTYEGVTPWDFATIYNVMGAWDAQLDGTGQTIAIAGRSNIVLSDVATFRSAFDLPVNAPTVIVNGTDPGTSNADDRTENTLDVEWSGAVAKNATIKLVTTKSTATTDGAMVSAQYIIDHKLASVMSHSYGQCELLLGATNNTAYNKMWQQGAAEGISIFVAAGDSAAGGCQSAFQSSAAASYGLQVNGIASTPYNVAVGGTDFIWANLTTKYWNAKNAPNGSSAMGYIPEVPWNDSCASDDVDKLLGLFAKGDDEEQSCMYMLNNSFDLGNVTVTGGGGGVSACTAPTGTTPSTCAGGYSKPTWQTGTGVPKDGKRDIPDLSLFASNGGLNSFYIICDSGSKPCDFTNADDTMAQGAGGTSIAAPAMAGIMALIVEKTGAPQGLPNPVFYTLASKENLTNCSPLMVSSGTSCVFYDINEDNIAAPCLAGTPNCNVETKGDSAGILSGYKAGVGYDLATGLGSVNAENLINAWSSVSPGPAVSISPTKLTFPSTAVGQSSASQVITVKNTGTAFLVFPANSIGIFGTDYKSFPATTTCTAPIAPGSTCVITVTFKPTEAGPLSSTAQVGDNAPGSPQQVALTGTGTGGTAAVSLSASTLTFSSTMVGQSSSSQTVTLKNNGTGALTFNATPFILSGGSTDSFLVQSNCSGTLYPASSCTTTVTFKPKTAGQLLTNLQFMDNLSVNTQIVVLKGTATPPPVLQLSTSTVNFYNTQVGAQSTASLFYAQNTSPYPITVSAPSVTGANASSFLVLNNCPASLGGGSSCWYYVAFKPTTAGMLSASVNISDSADKSAQTVALTGVAIAVPPIGISPTSITFPATTKGTFSTVTPVTITNLATSTTSYIEITGITITGANASSFAQVSDCAQYLIPGLNCRVYVAFAPTTTGTLKATLTITDSGANSPQTVTLTGTGK